MLSNKHIKFVDDRQRGVQFLDISPILADPDAFWSIISKMRLRLRDAVRGMDMKITDFTIVGVESRGFIFASALAYSLRVPLIMCRKRGKLVEPTIAVDIQNEYDSYVMELPTTELHNAQNIILVDDIIATGGTLDALRALLSYKLNKTVIPIAAIELEMHRNILPNSWLSGVKVKLPDSK